MTSKLKSKLIILALVLLLGVFGAVSLYLDRLAVQTSVRNDLPIFAVSLAEGEKKAALTFDAAWGNEDTEKLIGILAKYNVKATFFVIGQWAEKYPDSVRALYEAGHDVMNHSYDHPHYTALSSAEMVRNVTRASDVIGEITGVRPNLFRAPYGDHDKHVVETMRNAGYYTIQWDVDSLDWKDLSAPEITSRVLSRVKPGSIILFHNAALHTPEALPDIIENLQNDGYTLVKVQDLIYKNNYTINHEGRQIPMETN